MPWATGLTGTSAPGGSSSAAIRAVRTLVTLAGGRGAWAFPWSSTAPVSASTRTHDLGGGGGAGAVVGAGGGGGDGAWARWCAGCRPDAAGAAVRIRQASAAVEARKRRIG